MAKVIVDPRKCEGKKDCLRVCPENVFAMRKPVGLPWLVMLKVKVHGGKQAVVEHEEACTACMKCIDACPEDAIQVFADPIGSAGLAGE